MSLTTAQLEMLTAALDRSNVKSRKQAGRQLSYIEGWHAISEANRIFGFASWESETVEYRLVNERETKIGQPPNQRDGWSVSYVAKVRVRVHAGDRVVVREGIGAGHGIDASLGLAHESAIKEAETDARKRALMTWGNPFGLALYDKEQRNVADDVEQPRHDERGDAPAPQQSRPEPDPQYLPKSQQPSTQQRQQPKQAPQAEPAGISERTARAIIAGLGAVYTVDQLESWQAENPKGSPQWGRMSKPDRDKVLSAWQLKKTAVTPKGAVGRGRH